MPSRLSRSVGYPRRTIRIAVEHLRRKPAAIVARSALDKVIVIRAGKPTWTVVRNDYYDTLVDRVRELGPDAASNGLPRRMGPKPAAKWRAARSGLNEG